MFVITINELLCLLWFFTVVLRRHNGNGDREGVSLGDKKLQHYDATDMTGYDLNSLSRPANHPPSLLTDSFTGL